MKSRERQVREGQLMVLVMAVRAFFAWLFTLVFWFFLLLIHLLTFRAIPDRCLIPLIHFWAKSTLAIAGIRLELLNECPFRDRQGRVIVVNHQSALELIWGAVVLPPGFLVIGKKEIIYVPVMNVIWWGMRLIRVDRGNHVKAVAALAGVAQEIREHKRSLIVAPEGTRTRNGEIGPFKKGAFRMAVEAGVPIYPMVVSGAYEVLPRGRIVPRPGVLRVQFLPPVSPEGARLPDGSISQEFIEKIRSDMIACERQMRMSR